MADTMNSQVAHNVWTSIKDRIYQRSVNLRKTYRELDAAGTGMIPIDEMLKEMERQFQLSETEKKYLRILLINSDFKKDGVIDFSEFCEMLKTSDYKSEPTMTDHERRRFQQKGLMDSKMQSAVLSGSNERRISIKGQLPTNELGPMSIECPYGVLGDSERMDACIATYLNIKSDHLRTVFQKHDSNRDGYVTWDEFKRGMQELDHYIFDEEIKTLLHSIDKKKKGLIGIDEFAKTAGKEYLKKKAHRSTGVIDNPFVWEEPAVSPRTPRIAAAGEKTTQPRKPLKKSGSTRASELRTSGNRNRMLEIHERQSLENTKRTAAGTQQYTMQSPRLPPI